MKHTAKRVLIADLMLVASVTIASARVHSARGPALQAIYASLEYQGYVICYQMGMSGLGPQF